jgi:hypothetical protein
VLPWLYSFMLCFVMLNCSQINFHHIPPYYMLPYVDILIIYAFFAVYCCVLCARTNASTQPALPCQGLGTGETPPCLCLSISRVTC